MNQELWAGVERPFLELNSLRNIPPQVMRLWFCAMARVQRNGHARFAQGELAEILGFDISTGEEKSISPQSASNVVRKAKELGIIEVESTVNCLIPTGRRNNTGDMRVIKCFEH